MVLEVACVGQYPKRTLRSKGGDDRPDANRAQLSDIRAHCCVAVLKQGNGLFECLDWFKICNRACKDQMGCIASAAGQDSVILKLSGTHSKSPVGGVLKYATLAKSRMLQPVPGLSSLTRRERELVCPRCRSRPEFAIRP
jgi:hypothetical protein